MSEFTTKAEDATIFTTKEEHVINELTEELHERKSLGSGLAFGVTFSNMECLLKYIKTLETKCADLDAANTVHMKLSVVAAKSSEGVANEIHLLKTLLREFRDIADPMRSREWQELMKRCNKATGGSQ